MRLVLFDIDGTLLHCGGRTRLPLASALEWAYGTAGSLLDDTFAGKTDDQIVFDALLSAGFDEGRISEALPRAKRRYLESLERSLGGGAIELLPGVSETLDRLQAEPQACVGLLTGNWEAGARWKLEHFDLNEFFAVGAFGDGCRDRAGLPPIAIEEAARHYGHEFAAADVLIVGDTPNDVRCGREHGIPVAALATGFASAEELAAAGADWVFDDLTAAGFLLPLLSAARSPQSVQSAMRGLPEASGK